ncbi:hypothetical protein [Pedobacter sp. BMA]|uniref:hypothetical protein n=1 Tax=Pedobacter sp. BMA TaxID=1663685 RepID=UPI000649EEBC|nr:hypothetical protein [Pedobacter sp. BMA]KLT63898.1 hypothetical protein AB669_19400 [Pedobacter sp. BMA]
MKILKWEFKRNPNRGAYLSLCLIVCVLSLVIYSCKKQFGDDQLSENVESRKLLAVAKKLYATREASVSPTSKFHLDWENYFVEGDSILVVQSRGINSLDPDKINKDHAAMISGTVFRFRDENVVNVRVLEFYGESSLVKNKGLHILAGYGSERADQSDVNGTVFQYSPRHHRSMGGYVIKNGNIDLNNRVYQRKLISKSLEGERTVLAKTSSSCDPVYLIVYIKQTGQIISQTFLYNSCDEEGDSKDSDIVVSVDQDNSNACSEVGDVLKTENAGEANSITIEAESPTKRKVILNWTVIRNPVGFWEFTSTEIGHHVKVNGEWKWDQDAGIEHLKTGLQGVTPGADISFEQFVIVPVMGIYYSGVQAFFNYKSVILCDDKLNPIKGVNMPLKINSPAWHVNDGY